VQRSVYITLGKLKFLLSDTPREKPKPKKRPPYFKQKPFSKQKRLAIRFQKKIPPRRKNPYAKYFKPHPTKYAPLKLYNKY
jgi:hypothetical protein